MPRGRFTDEQRRAIVHRWLAGEPSKAVAAEFEIARVTLYLWADKLNIPRKRRKDTLPEDLKKRVLQLRAEGKTLQSIVNEAGVSRSMAQRIYTAAGMRGWTPFGEAKERARNRREVAVGMRRSGATLQVIGDYLGVTKERARQYLVIENCCPLCGCSKHRPLGEEK